ncbi:MAG: helix-turn-helix domain-containing protein [Roseovarius sp.]
MTDDLRDALRRIEARLDHLSGHIEPEQQSIFLTPKETAHMLRVGESTLKRWRAEGGGPMYVKEGRIVRYSRDAVARYDNRRAAGLS